MAVLDAGTRDNYGQVISLRLIESFRKWLQEITANVVLIEISDASDDSWNNTIDNGNILGFITAPLTLLQNN